MNQTYEIIIIWGGISYLIIIQVHFKLEATFDNDAFLK